MRDKAIELIAKKLVKQDFVDGPLYDLMLDNVESVDEVKPFLKGVGIGTAYAIKMIISGKLDLTIIERKGESDANN